jgi:hypothetical protein
MKEFEDILSNIALIGIAILVVLLVARAWYLWHTRHPRKHLGAAPKAVIVLRIASALGFAMLGFGLVAYLFVLQRGSAFMPIGLKIALAGLLLAVLAFEITARLWPKLPAGRLALARGFAGTLACWVVGGFLVTLFWTASRYPPEGYEVLLDPPFEGTWVAIGAGATGRTNHHNRILSQRFAIDIAKACPDGRLFRGKGTALDESCTFGAAILAPAAGVVTHVVDGLPDGDSKKELAGNHVIIRLAEERYVALAHLKQGSIVVAPGDTVEPGQKIGLAGNSGNSDFPHLHIHVQNGPVYDIRKSISIPFRFRNAEVKRFLFWHRVNSVALLSNDRIRADAISNN